MSKEIFNKSNADSLENIWDDTALIKMYEDSIKTTVDNSQGVSHSWKAGDKCTAPYPDDGLWYRATISKILGDKALVVYEGYEQYGETDVLLTDLAHYTEGEEEESNVENGETSAPLSDERRNNVSHDFDKTMKETFGPSGSNFLPPFAPPPPPIFDNLNKPDQIEALSSMLMSWYMSGYHTGCYVTMMRNQNGKNQ